MKMEVATPSEFLGTVIGDLSSRRGQINGTTDAFVSPLLLLSFLWKQLEVMPRSLDP